MGSRLRVSNRNFATSAYKDDHFSLSLLDFRANSRLIIPRGEKYRGGGNTLSLSLSPSRCCSRSYRARMQDPFARRLVICRAASRQ